MGGAHRLGSLLGLEDKVVSGDPVSGVVEKDQAGRHRKWK